MSKSDYNKRVASLLRKSKYYADVSAILSTQFDAYITNQIVGILFTSIYEIDSCTEAAEMGNLNLLIFSHEAKCYRNFKENNDGIIFDYTSRVASKYGHLNCLKYAVENHFNTGLECIECAVNGGHLECIKYLLEKDVCLNNHL
jgi:hypothetical protein